MKANEFYYQSCLNKKAYQLFLSLIFLFISVYRSVGQQVPDTNFQASIYQAAYQKGEGPAIFIDAAHNNFHKKQGGFFAFGQLAEQDGYVVKGLTEIISHPEILKGCKILVIANSLNKLNVDNWALPTPSAFTNSEIVIIQQWVKNGGRLFLIADHMPFAGAAIELGKAFGFEFLNGFAFAGEPSWPPSIFSFKTGTLKDSPVTRGLKAYEKTDSIATFTGSAFKSPQGAIPVLAFLKEHYVLLPDTAWQFNGKTPKQNLDGFHQGAILNFGKGKVAVFGEAAMFTAQIANGTMKVGFNSEEAPNNAQFALNLIHWLDGIKDYHGVVMNARETDTAFPKLTGPYLGQAPPGNTSKIFAPGIVSTDFGELNAVFTKSGHEFYFSRRGIPGKPSAIMVSRMLKIGWTIPVPVDFTGTCSDIDPFITSDNRSMVFCSTRPHQKGGQKKEDHDFWISKREGNKWSEPALFANETSSGYEDFFPVVTASDNLYFNSQRGGSGTNDIFCAKFSAGKYTLAENLPEPINTKYREFDAFVSPDETMILFSSERPGGYGGADIYLSWKNIDGKWVEPRNMGSEINSAGSEYGASMSYDGKYFFYTSNKGGSEDIFWVSADVIKELRQKPLSKPKEICTLTYIANEGFLIGTENKKILVDALFGGIKGNWCDQPGDSISRMMIKGIAPFDSIDVVLLTHLHSDHFNSGMTIDFLKANRKSVMICPDQVNERLKSNSAYAEVSDRITAIKSKDHPDTIIGINGINIRVMHLKHGSWFETDSVTGKKVDLHEGVENLGYLIESDGTLVLHTGDCNAANKSQFTALNLSSKEIDAAFFDRAFLKPEGFEIIAENIRSRNIILMHLEPARREYYKSYIKDIPNFYVFNRQMEKMIIENKILPDETMKRKISMPAVLLFCSLIPSTYIDFANNISVSGISLSGQNVVNHYSMISFNISWGLSLHHSLRDTMPFTA